MDILDELQEEERFVSLVLMTGEEILGLAHGIIWEDDSDGWPLIKTIMFQPYGQKDFMFFTEDEIRTYKIAGEDQLPFMPAGSMDWWA